MCIRYVGNFREGSSAKLYHVWGPGGRNPRSRGIIKETAYKVLEMPCFQVCIRTKFLLALRARMIKNYLGDYNRVFFAGGWKREVNII